MAYYMGVDGGGSTVRVVICDEALQAIATNTQAHSVNPGSVGADVAKERIQAAMFAAMQQVSDATIAAVGIGVAGASAAHSAAWLRDVVQAILPDSRVVPSSDHEIALVGANGVRHGVLILSGTGSVVFGINAEGESAQAGGWGYLLGDEGSGYWLGLQALRHITRAADGLEATTPLTDRILEALNLQRPHDLIHWLYRSDNARTTDIADLARHVIDAADDIAQANALIEQGAYWLQAQYRAVCDRLQLHDPQIAFTGGLLLSDNALSRRLCAFLNLPGIPKPQYPPVMGAALLATLSTT